MIDKPTLFISYSHRNEDYKEYVVSHLGVAEKQGLLETWDDRRIAGGGAWRREIEAALDRASITILLVSRHSLTSDFILDEEVARMLQRRDREGLSIYPIVIRACDWEAVDWLAAMNLRPVDGKPLARFTLDRRDEVMAAISKEIRGLLQGAPNQAITLEEPAPSPRDDELDRLARQTEALSDELGTTKAALNAMFETLADQPVPAEQLEIRLREIAERHVALTERLQRLDNDAPEVAELRQQAAAAIGDSDYDRADVLLEQAEAVDDEALRELEEMVDRRKLSKARTRSERGDLERTRLNYRKAAEHFAEAARLLPASEEETCFGYLMKQAKALKDQGDEFGDNAALAETIDAYHSILNTRTRESAQGRWASAQLHLGNALKILGERESSTANLEAAAQAYEAAAEGWPRDSDPLNWAAAQVGSGIALSDLGERESGTESLEEAVDAFRAALEEYTRECSPLDWAMTQNNLGIALQNLGLRESGTERLEEAVDAYRAALEEYTRERVPLNWAMTQNNLGNALKLLGERTSNRDQLEAALDAVKQASDVYLNEAGQTHHEAEFRDRIQEIEAALARLTPAA